MTKYPKLEESVKRELIRVHKTERDKRICDRIKAVLLYDKGYSPEEIADILLLHSDTVREHLRDYHYKDNKLEKESGGSECRLKKHELEELAEHLDQNTYTSASDILVYIKDKYHIEYTVIGITKLLHRMGFTYKPPKPVPGKLDPIKQEMFKAMYKELKTNLPSDEVIYFMDSVHPQYQSKPTCGWIRAGVTKTLPTYSGWKRKHIIGALNLQSLDVITTDNPKVNGEHIVSFLKTLESAHQNTGYSKIHLICDNAGYHKSKKVKEYLEKSKVKLIFLPPYSPNLNPIERLWKFMHSIVRNNKHYKSFDSFCESVNNFFTHIPKYMSKLKTLINDNFQTVVVNHC